MKHEIHDPLEIHLFLTEKYQGSTANIIVRVLVDCTFSTNQLSDALIALGNRHPYILARYFSGKDQRTSARVYCETKKNRRIKFDVERCTDQALKVQMDTLSEMRHHLFDHEKGKLCHLRVFQSENSSLVEFSASHIIGEVPSVIILLGDLLGFLDQSLEQDIEKVEPCKKFIFDEELFGWPKAEQTVFSIEVPEESQRNFHKWTLGKSDYRRFSITIDQFKGVSNFLKRNNINAKVVDVFYYEASRILYGILKRDPNFWLIMGYRHLLKDRSLRSSVFNFAFFEPVSYVQFDTGDVNKWLEAFYQYRKKLITPDGVAAARNFFNSLNVAMQGTDISYGRMLMNSVVKFPDFAFNNYGEIDNYIGVPQRFSLIDIDIQNGVPGQEIRFYTFRGKLFFNVIFSKEEPVNVDHFWKEFTQRILSTYCSEYG